MDNFKIQQLFDAVQKVILDMIGEMKGYSTPIFKLDIKMIKRKMQDHFANLENLVKVSVNHALTK